MEFGRNLDPPVRWVRAYWDEPDLIGSLAEDLDSSSMQFLYELTAAGVPLRAIELTGTDLTPVGAASLAEFWEAQDYRHQAFTSRQLENQDRFGSVPEGSEADWGDYPHDEISREEFEREWDRARAHLRVRPRSAHFAR